MSDRKLSYYSTEEMLALEVLASEKYGISTDAMMRQAGRSIHDFVTRELPEVRRVLVLAGKGNNGGDALVAGELLTESHLTVTAFRGDTPLPDGVNLKWYDLIIDGLFGFSLRGNPRPPMDQIIEQINCSGVSILAIDVPSGMEVYSGKIMQPCVRATYTMALGMLKKGLETNSDYAGTVYLGNLGIPKEAYQERSVEMPDFSEKNYLPLGYAPRGV